MDKYALVIGNSDGIGLELTRELLRRGFVVNGLSKRETSIRHANYKHFICDVTDPNYRAFLSKVLANISAVHLCVYCAGIGDQLNLGNLAFETKVFQVNLMAAVITTEIVFGKMLKENKGHFMGLSSISDGLTSPNSPSYSASKAGISKYWEALGLALNGERVHITNVRLGFVDTKMAKSSFKPFMISPTEAARFVLGNLQKPRIRATKPLRMAAVVWFLERLMQVRIWLR
jgi:short-subunit dehydrogenase